MKSVREKPTNFQNTKVRDYSQFTADLFNYDLSQVEWISVLSNATNDMDKIFSSFYSEFNKIVNEHALWGNCHAARRNNVLNLG